MNMKKRLILLSAALLIAFCALPIFAANVTGKWTAEDKDARWQPVDDHLRLQAGRDPANWHGLDPGRD